MFGKNDRLFRDSNSVLFVSDKLLAETKNTVLFKKKSNILILQLIKGLRTLQNIVDRHENFYLLKMFSVIIY